MDILAAVTPSMLAQTAGPVTAIAASMATSDMKKNDADEGNYEKFDYDKYGGFIKRKLVNNSPWPDQLANHLLAIKNETSNIGE